MDQWKYVKYARRGLKHSQEGRRIQSAIEILENDRAVAAVLCAGDDSLNYSEVAAAEVSSGICKVLLQISDDLGDFEFDDEEQVYQLRKALIQEARRIIRVKAKANSIDKAQMDCALSFVLISKADQCAAAGNLGSNAVAMIREGESALICAPDPAGRLTVYSADAENELQLRFFNLNDSTLHGFLLTTAGLKDELFTEGSALLKRNAEKYINALFANDPEGKLDSYISSLTASADTPYQDDFCFAVLSRNNMPEAFREEATWLCRCGSRNKLNANFCMSCGMAFDVLYKSIDFSRYGGKDMLFNRLNSLPDQEKALLDQCVADLPESERVKIPSVVESPPPAPRKQPKPVEVQSTLNHIQPQSPPSFAPRAVRQSDEWMRDDERMKKLDRHEWIIWILCILIICLLLAFAAVAGIHLMSNRTDDNNQNNSTEVDQSGDTEQSQDRKPIRFH